MKPKVTIADCTFLQYTKSCSLGGPNIHTAPSSFEWELAPAKEARFVTDSFLKDAAGPGQVGLLLESFFLHPENYFTSIDKPFDYVLTHNRYFAENFNWLWYPHGGSWVDFNSWGLRTKTKNISVLLSGKKTMPGHKLYHEIVERYGSMVDVFGLETWATKERALADYRYSIVVEAEKCSDFFSEKLMDCFSLGTVPIYWGCPNIERYFNPRGLERITSWFELDALILSLGESDYSKRMYAISQNLELAREYSISEDWIFREYPFLFQETK